MANKANRWRTFEALDLLADLHKRDWPEFPRVTIYLECWTSATNTQYYGDTRCITPTLCTEAEVDYWVEAKCDELRIAGKDAKRLLRRQLQREQAKLNRERRQRKAS